MMVGGKLNAGGLDDIWCFSWYLVFIIMFFSWYFRWFSELKFMGTHVYKLYFVYGTDFCWKVCEHASVDPTSALGSWIKSRFYMPKVTHVCTLKFAGISSISGYIAQNQTNVITPPRKASKPDDSSLGRNVFLFLPVCHALDLWMFLREKDENDQASQEAVEIEKQRVWQLRIPGMIGLEQWPLRGVLSYIHMESASWIEWTSCNLDNTGYL